VPNRTQLPAGFARRTQPEPIQNSASFLFSWTTSPSLGKFVLRLHQINRIGPKPWSSTPINRRTGQLRPAGVARVAYYSGDHRPARLRSFPRFERVANGTLVRKIAVRELAIDHRLLSIDIIAARLTGKKRVPRVRKYDALTAGAFASSFSRGARLSRPAMWISRL